MTDFWAAAPSNGLGLDPAPAAKPLKKNPKPFVGRLEVQPKVVLGDPCDISAFCSRHARARRLYDDRRWDDLLKFMQEPRTRAWWSEPLVYRPEEFRSQQPYLESEYFANANCGGVVKVCLPGEGSGAAWVDVSKLSVKELASKLRDRAILPTGVRKEDARTLEKQLDSEAARRQYCMVAKGPEGDSMWSDIQSLQREPLDPRGEFLVNYGKRDGAKSTTALAATGSIAGPTQSANGAGFWLDDEVAFAFYFLARQRVLSPTDRGSVPYPELTRAEKDLVLAVARRMICEELRNWFDLVAEIIRERLKCLHVRRTDFYTRNVSLISKCECGALAGHLEGMDGSLIDRGHGYFVAPEEDPAMARTADYLLLCPNPAGERPYCVKLLKLLTRLTVGSRADAGTGSVSGSSRVVSSMALTALATTGTSDGRNGAGGPSVSGGTGAGSAGSGEGGASPIERLKHTIAVILQDVYQMVHPAYPHEELQLIFSIIRNTRYDGAAPQLLLDLVYMYFIILDERHGKFDVDVDEVPFDRPRKAGCPSRVCLVPTGLNDDFLERDEGKHSARNNDIRHALHVREGGGPFILRLASAPWRGNSSAGASSSAGDCISKIKHLISNMELQNSLIACLWAGWWVFCKQLDVTPQEVTSIRRYCQAELKHEYSLRGTQPPAVQPYLTSNLLGRGLQAKADGGHAINLHVLFMWPEKNVQKGEHQTPNIMKFIHGTLLQPASLHSHSRGADTSRIFGAALNRVEALNAFFANFFDLVVLNSVADPKSTTGTGLGEDTWLMPDYRVQDEICKWPNQNMDSFEDMVQTAARLATLQPDTFLLQRRTETEKSFLGFESPREFFHYLEQALDLNEAQLRTIRLLVFACGAQREVSPAEAHELSSQQHRSGGYYDSGGSASRGIPGKTDVTVPWILRRLRGCTCAGHKFAEAPTSAAASSGSGSSSRDHDRHSGRGGGALPRSGPDPWQLQDLGLTWHLEIDKMSLSEMSTLPVCLQWKHLTHTFLVITERIHEGVIRQDEHTDVEGPVKHEMRQAKWKLETEVLHLFARLAGSPEKSLGIYAYVGGGKARTATQRGGLVDGLDASDKGAAHALKFDELPDIFANLERKQRLASRHDKHSTGTGFQDDEPSADGELVLAAQLSMFRASLRFATESATMDFFVSNARGPRPGETVSGSRGHDSSRRRKSNKKSKSGDPKSNAPSHMLIVFDEDNINDPCWCWPKLLIKLALTEIQCIRVQGEAMKTLATIAQCHVKGQDFAWVDLVFASFDNKKTRGFNLIAATTGARVGPVFNGQAELSIRGRLQAVEKMSGCYYYLTGFLSMLLALVDSIPAHQAHERLRCLGYEWREQNQGFYPYLYFVLEVLFAHRSKHLHRAHMFIFQPETRWQKWQITALCLAIVRCVLEKYQDDPNMQQDFVDIRAVAMGAERNGAAGTAAPARDTAGGSAAAAAGGTGGRIVNDFAPWEYQPHSPSSAFDIMWLLTVSQSVHGGVTKGSEPPLLSLIFQVLDSVMENDALKDPSACDDEFRCWPMRAVGEATKILEIASSLHGAFQDAHDAVRVHCEHRDREREEQLGQSSASSAFAGRGLGPIASSNLSILPATTGPSIAIQRDTGDIRVHNPRRERPTTFSATSDAARTGRTRAPRGAGTASNVRGRHASLQLAQQQQQQQALAEQVQATAQQFLIPMEVEFKRIEDILDSRRLQQIARLVTWPEEPEASSLQIEWCVCNVYDHQISAAALLRAVHRRKQDQDAVSRRRAGASDPFLALLGDTFPNTVPLLSRKIAALAGSERYRPVGTRFFGLTFEDAANVCTFRPWAGREQERRKYELSASLLSLLLESLYTLPDQAGPVPKLAHALLGLAPVLAQPTEQQRRLAFPLPNSNVCLFQILASMVQATELLLTSRPETMRHFALLTQLVTLLCSQAATRDFFPSFLLRANDNEVLEAIQIFCRPHADVLCHYFDPNPETAPMRPTQVQLLNNDEKTEVYVRTLVHFLEGANWAVRYLSSEVFDLVAGAKQAAGQRHLGAGFHQLIQDVVGLQGPEDGGGALGHATDFNFSHTLQKLAWYSTRRRKSWLVGATVRFFGDLHRQLLESDVEAYKDATRQRDGRLLVVQYCADIAKKAHQQDQSHVVAVSRRNVGFNDGVVNMAVPLDELAFGCDWIISDYAFVDTDRRRGRPDEPETNTWPLEGPEDQDSRSISWRNPNAGCPQEQAKRYPDRFVIKRYSRRVAGEPVQVTTYYGPDVAELIKQAELGDLPNRTKYFLQRHPLHPGAPDGARGDTIEAPCGSTHFGLQLDLQSLQLREAREPFISPLRAVATAADAATGSVVGVKVASVVPFFCARAFVDPGRVEQGRRTYGSTGMEALQGHSSFYGRGGPRFSSAASVHLSPLAEIVRGSGAHHDVELGSGALGGGGLGGDFLSQVLRVEERLNRGGSGSSDSTTGGGAGGAGVGEGSAGSRGGIARHRGQRSSNGWGIQTSLPPVDRSVSVEGSSSLYGTPKSTMGASGIAGAGDLGGVLANADSVAGRYHLGRLLGIFKHRMRQWCADGGASSANRAAGGGIGYGRGAVAGGQWPYLRELFSADTSEDWDTLRRSATLHNLSEELSEVQATLVTASRELATLYLRIDRWESGITMARMLLRKTLFFLHRLYVQGAASAVERGVDSNLARLASACIDHVLHHTAANTAAAAAAGAGAGAGAPDRESTSSPSSTNVLGTDEAVEFALEAVPMIVVCLLPHQKPELCNLWASGFSSTQDTSANGDTQHCLGARQSDLLLQMRHGQTTSAVARHSLYVSLQQSLRAAVPDDDDLQQGAFSLELRRQRRARLTIYRLLRDTHHSLYEQLLDDALKGPVEYRSCALVTLSQLFQVDHSEHWVMYLRDGGFLAMMLSQLANMLAILWYPSAQGEPQPASAVQRQLSLTASTFPRAASVEASRLRAKLQNPLAAQINATNREAWVANAVALVYMLLTLAQQRFQTFPSGNEDDPDQQVSCFVVRPISQEDCVRTMVELNLFGALSGVDPATAHLHQQEDDGQSAGLGIDASSHSPNDEMRWTGKANFRRITRGVLRLFCAVAQIVPCRAQPQVLLRPSMALLKKRYQLSIKSTIKDFLDFAKRRRLLMATQRLPSRYASPQSSAQGGGSLPFIYPLRRLDDIHMLTTTLMVVAQMFHHVPPGYGSSTETTGSFSWALANSLMRELQWLALRLLKAFHLYSLDRTRANEYLQTSQSLNGEADGAADPVDTITTEYEILRNLLLFCLYRQSSEAATGATLSVRRLAHPWFKPGTMEEDERRVLFRQPEFHDAEYGDYNDDVASGRGLHPYAAGHDGNGFGGELHGAPAAHVAGAGSDGASFSLAAIENIIVRTAEILVLRRTEGVHAIVEGMGGDRALQWRLCEAEMVRCIGIALAVYVAHIRFFDESLNHRLRFPLPRRSAVGMTGTTPDAASIERVRDRLGVAMGSGALHRGSDAAFIQDQLRQLQEIVGRSSGGTTM